VSADFAHCPGCFAIGLRDRAVRHRVRCAFDGTTREDWPQGTADALEGVKELTPVTADLRGAEYSAPVVGKEQAAAYRALLASITRAKP
jgi:hypothetical protein